MPISEVYNECNMLGMKRYPDKFWDLCITSPPYNLGNGHHTGNKKINPYFDDLPEYQYQENQILFLEMLYRHINDEGCIFYNHKNRIKDGKLISPYEWIFKTNWIIKQELVWFNGSQNFDKCRFYPMTERVFWLSKTKTTKFYNKINHHDLFYWQAQGTNKFHTRSFPIQMPKDILSCFPKDLKVIDPFLGSGSTRIAAYMLGFDFWGWEIDKEYFDLQQDRFSKYDPNTISPIAKIRQAPVSFE